MQRTTPETVTPRPSAKTRSKLRLRTAVKSGGVSNDDAATNPLYQGNNDMMNPLFGE